MAKEIKFYSSSEVVAAETYDGSTGVVQVGQDHKGGECLRFIATKDGWSAQAVFEHVDFLEMLIESLGSEAAQTILGKVAVQNNLRLHKKRMGVWVDRWVDCH